MIKSDRIYKKDARVGLQEIPRQSIDLIITDPPFAIKFGKKKANYNRTESNVLDGYVEISEQDYPYFMEQWIQQAYRVLKEDGSMYVVSSYNHLHIVRQALKEAGFHLQNEIIWKYQFGVRTKNKFVTSHYPISFVTKKKTGYNFYPNNRFTDQDKTETGGSARYADMEDVWIIPRENWTGEVKTPTKLPTALISKMLGYSSKPGDVILDPFLGSGQVATTAKAMDRHYIGFEIVKDYVEFARKRLRRIK